MLEAWQHLLIIHKCKLQLRLMGFAGILPSCKVLGQTERVADRPASSRLAPRCCKPNVVILCISSTHFLCTEARSGEEGRRPNQRSVWGRKMHRITPTTCWRPSTSCCFQRNKREKFLLESTKEQINTVSGRLRTAEAHRYHTYQCKRRCRV